MNEPDHLQAVALLLAAALTSNVPTQAGYSHDSPGLLAFEAASVWSWIEPTQAMFAQSPPFPASGARDVWLHAGHAHHRQPAKG